LIINKIIKAYIMKG